MLQKFGVLRISALDVAMAVCAVVLPYGVAPMMAQAPAAARQLGTVTAISGSGLTLKTDAGQEVAIKVADGAHILQLAPGSTDLKTAQAIELKDIAIGDRVLASGKAGDSAATLEASRVILMKSSDIAQKHQMEQADWQKRGTGGIVSVSGCRNRDTDGLRGHEEDRCQHVEQDAVPSLRRRFGQV